MQSNSLLKQAQNRSNERGAMLIVTMGVLTLLAVLGTTFVSLMRLERQATRNYVDGQLVDQVNDSAIDRAISDLAGGRNFLSYTSYVNTPWIYHEYDTTGKRTGFLAHGKHDLSSPKVSRWDILTEEEERVHRYKLKVIDTSAQINLNGKQDTTARLLENLAVAITSSTRLNKKNENPLYAGPRQTGNKLKGIHIMQFRNRLDGRKFKSKSQLKEIIGEENYKTIKDFITIHSWEDPYTYAGVDGIPEVPDPVTGRSGGGGGGGVVGGGGNNTHPQVEALASRVKPEPRSPVNINSAPPEVITACIMGIGGRRPFPYARLTYSTIDEGSTVKGQRVPGQEEVANVDPRGIWVYTPQFTYDEAQRITDRIVAMRQQPSTQFMAWSTGANGRGGFAEFINSLEESFFPSPQRAIVLEPRNLQDRRIQSEVINPGTEISRLWVKGHDSKERSLRVQAGLPYHQRNAWYYETVKATLIANFNPNTRLNNVNPNLAAAEVVDKANLITLDDDRRTPLFGHTTEFCFDATGVFEITAMGDLSSIDQATKSIILNDPSYRITQKDHAKFSPLYRKKMRTVVKVWDMVRHTNQFHFEKTFQSGGFSSRNNRKNILTWPDAMPALTELVSQGSVRDGRIELAGYNDGLRNQMAPASQSQSFQSPEVLVGVNTFQYRSEKSFNDLRRYSRGGAEATEQFSTALREVLDFDYNRNNMRSIKYNPRRLMLLKLGGRVAIGQDPLVGREAAGSNIRPDGLQTSLFNDGHLGAKILHLGAHNLARGDQVETYAGRLGNAQLQQAVGAGPRRNNVGNVPYYSGGLAFWVKFEFNADDPVFSGLIGCTQVIEDVPLTQAQVEGSEGTQFYIFKNTKGQLRIVRMYYHQAFPMAAAGGGGASGGGGGGGGEGGGTGLLSPDLSHLSEGGQENLDELERILDPKKPVARSDLLVDIRHFKAKEWHHIAVDWSDENPGQPISVWIDFEKISGGGPYIPQEDVSNLPTAWVRLNQIRPVDGLYVGGFVRHQAEADHGLFKWYTNITSNSGGGGVRSVESNVKRILANATIDELVTYNGTFSGAKRYYTQSTPGYFTNKKGEYVNIMEIPMPPEVDHVVMRSFDWTSYYPSFFWGNMTTRAPAKLNVQPVQVQVYLGRDTQTFQEPWRQPNLRNRIAGRRAIRPQARGIVGRPAELTYRFQLTPARMLGGSLAGGSVATPVIDDVTATYYLPNPRVIYQEEEDL